MGSFAFENFLNPFWICRCCLLIQPGFFFSVNTGVTAGLSGKHA
ncbi:hypothetical protein HMPREF3213_03332 [Heyndrickxia coagulans]|uniref:Uncharacterized protein n=1 Tax=Heyndrickxia coagulans TaxID=1398 RepID=A0A133KC51_HEYCO|nr:hypothetical protein HMPREF3213_03332 [Heyndrickxia coagulans]